MSPALAMEKLEQFGLADYFLWPQINWNPKSASVKTISERLSLGLDCFAFVDDQPFERAEVSFAHPKVLCIDAAELGRHSGSEANASQVHHRGIQDPPVDVHERRAPPGGRARIHGTNEEFLANLNMDFTIFPVGDDDLKRAEELTVRTHQLNTTGYTYSYDELDELRHSPDHLLLDRRSGRQVRFLRQDRPCRRGVRPERPGPSSCS